MNPTTPPPRRADALRNREHLLATTRRMLAARGTDVSMDEIAKAAGLGSGTLYRHFPQRDELLAAVSTDLIAGLITGLEEAAAIPDPGDALQAGMQCFAGRIGANRAIRDVVLWRIGHRRMEQTPELIAARARAIELLDGLVRRAQQAGVLRTDVTATDLALVLGTVGRIRMAGNDDDLWERYLDLFFDGLAPQAATPLRHQPPAWLPHATPPAERR